MAYLVMLVTVLAIMHGVVHPYPRGSTNQQTKRQLECVKRGPIEVPVDSTEARKLNCIRWELKEIPLKQENEKRVEVESVKSKLDRYNKKWRLPRIENEELQTVFIIGTDDY